MMRKYFVFLDELRESGKTNMFGAPSYLKAMFGLTKKKATGATYAWTTTLGDGTQTVDARVELAEADLSRTGRSS